MPTIAAWLVIALAVLIGGGAFWVEIRTNRRDYLESEDRAELAGLQRIWERR